VRTAIYADIQSWKNQFGATRGARGFLRLEKGNRLGIPWTETGAGNRHDAHDRPGVLEPGLRPRPDRTENHLTDRREPRVRFGLPCRKATRFNERLTPRNSWSSWPRRAHEKRSAQTERAGGIADARISNCVCDSASAPFRKGYRRSVACRGHPASPPPGPCCRRATARPRPNHETTRAVRA